MNITHFVENLNRGGLERTVIDLVRAQVELGHRCQIICLFERGTLADELAQLDVPVHACRKRHGFDMAALRLARRCLRAHATDILHTHNAAAHYHAVLASLGLSIRRIVNTRHGMGAMQTGSRREWLFRRSLFSTDAIVTVCEAARRQLLAAASIPAAKLFAIPNGIRIERFRTSDVESRSALVEMLGLPARTRLIGTVGRLVPAKDQTGLISAFAALRERFADCALVIIGDGALREKLASQTREPAVDGRVFLLGDRNDVAELLRGLDVFALSSLTEGYSIALLEACATALPIVATDVGGNAEIVRDGVNGRLVPARAPAALAHALHELLGDPERARAMGSRGRAWASKEGSFTTMAARYDALYAVAGARA